MQAKLSRFMMLAGLLLISSTGISSAQSYLNPGGRGYQPRSRPPLSPYLNLLRGGDPSTNYYLGVVRQRQQSATNQAFGGAILELDRNQRAPLTTTPGATSGPNQLLTPLGTTGHVTGFMSYGNYYSSGVGPLNNIPRFIGRPRSTGSRGR